ncbi:MAG: SDR family NAD(P)-dependent oxidoreductase [Hydrogenophaga sp.]|uniref:type I polyketide synthase n=1 Tax=Hydrogenophaga sp. TaxID=1904254 RepID=UPI001D794DB1|nr:type I polyketide synthase [Hydrogenophaga sp.]MBX3611472.1 SDR family NAD(P)-dependent oxidoreductase [Hydrogenophaga sp.]
MSDFLERISHFSPKRLALLADQLQSRVLALEGELAKGSSRDPIAIVGIGCRFPGGADTPEGFWEQLRDGVDAITEVPAQRWAINDYFDPDPDAAGRMNTRWGGFVGDVDGFDPHFFGISPREARSMDPQQRLLLEVTWRALEHAGIAADRIEGSRTGVFVGMSAGDYFQMLRDGGAEHFDAYTASGIAHSIASGRLSYVLGARGPSLSIDTACSSSLVAIHEAVQSLRRGECDAALAGGVNLILTPDVSVALSRAHMMAPDGRCKAFDARADGFVRSEGCAVLVLKRLADAKADGDRIVALIRGSAINQDGRSNGLTAPNGPSQEAVLRDALADAGVQPAQVGFVEAHGTGTSLGDPIEVQALARVLGEGRAAQHPLLIGSVKANVGHMEAAAGVGGVVKLAMALRHGQVPGQLHLSSLNPYIPWDELAVRVPTALSPWPEVSTGPRIGGVSSFGFSGTNVHLVLEEAPEPAPFEPADGADRTQHLLALSARSDVALRALASVHADALDGTSLADLAFSAHTGRAHFPHRLTVVAASAHDAAQALRAHAAGTDAPGAVAAVAGPRAPRVAFLFTGQGAQYVGMSRGLYETEPVFRRELDRCAAWLDTRLSRPLLPVLFGLQPDAAADALDDTAFTQPALFALEYALARLWMSWGVRPSMVMGHSVGEYVAACIADVLTLEEALLLISERGRLMGQLPRNGAMLSIAADEARVQGLIAGLSDALSIAAVNGPHSVVISGLASAVEAVELQCRADGLETTRLKVSHAFHSPLMEPMLAEFAQVVSTVQLRSPRIALISNLNGRPAAAEITQPAYWCEHVRAAVRFAPAVQAMVEAGVGAFLEIGPHPVLVGMGQDCVPQGEGTWLASLRRGRDDTEQMLGSLACLYGLGVAIDWVAFDSGRARQRVPVPHYPFQRERFWAPDDHTNSRIRGADRVAQAPGLPGREIAQSLTPDRLVEAHLGPSLQPWLSDHRILGTVLLPSPVYMEMARAAIAAHSNAQAVELRDFVVRRAQSVEGDQPVQVQLAVGEAVDGVSSLRIAVRDAEGAPWQTSATAQACACGVPARAAPSLSLLTGRVTEQVPVETYYQWLQGLGLEFGPLFRGVGEIRRADGEVLARMQWPEALQAEPDLQWHPARLDACFHVIGAALPDRGNGLEQAFLLLQIERVRWYRAPGRACWNHVRLRTLTDTGLAERETFGADMVLFDDDGTVLAEFDGMHFKRAHPQALMSQTQVPVAVQRMLHRIAWREVPAPGAVAVSVASIAEAVMPRLHTLAAEHDLDSYADFLPRLDTLAAEHVLQALQRLGASTDEGEDLGDVATLAARLGVLARHHRLLERMLAMLVEDGVLVRQADSYVVAHWRTPAPQAMHAELSERFPQGSAEIDLTMRCAGELAAVLRGQTDPLGLLFPGGSLADTERLYQYSPPAQVYNGVIADVLAAIARSWAAGRPLRVLEIGAGTGSTTHHVLSRLPQVMLEYTFTDVSPLFLHRAREKFGEAAFMRYAVLDIGRPPADQGFVERGYDVVIGANVLHATPDLDVTLGHVNRLLAPGGTLVLLEGTTPQRFGDLTVGLLDGWWAYTDTHRRSYALMEREGWLELLRQHGLADATALPGNTQHPVLQQQAVFVARMPQVPVERTARRWLIVPDTSGHALPLAVALQARGDQAKVLADGGPSLALALAEPDTWDGVVQLQALDAKLHDDMSVSALEQAQQTLIGGVLATVQTLSARSAAHAPRLWIITRGAQATCADEPADPSQATAWGLSHVVSVEHPELRCARLDLDPGASGEDSLARVVEELQADAAQDQIAWRGASRFVRRLVHHEGIPSTAGQVRIDAGSSYLITGGLRGLGLRVAEWMVEQGARHLILMGRQVPDQRASTVLDRLQARGVKVLAVQGDVSVRADLQRVLAEAAAVMPSLVGAVHAAGVLDDGVIASLSWSRFATVMGPKVLGSWNLHTLCPQLQFLVLFSSGASVAGSPGQANHAAANAFEDALAWYRQSQGLPTVSINWGPWADIGAAADRHLERPGSLRAITPVEGLAALAYAMRQTTAGALFAHAQLAALDSDWRHLAAQRAEGAAVAPLFDELLRDLAPSNKTQARPQSAEAAVTSLRDRLAAAAPNRRRTLLRDHVRQLTVKVLGVQRGEELDVTEPLRQLGLDSLMAVELRNLLGQSVGRTLPATLTFDHPSVAALTECLACEVFADLMNAPDSPAARPTASPAPVPEAATVAESFDDLSEDELAQQLLRRLDGLGPEEVL